MTDIGLKSDILSSLIKIFESNAQTRSVFQEVGGFVYVVSILVSLEGSLADPPVELWEKSMYFCLNIKHLRTCLYISFMPLH